MPTAQTDLQPSSATVVDAVIVGAGFAGLYMLHRLRSRGLVVRGFETGADVGGTWYWNRYPGARCDAESLYYSYSFSPELEQQWNWTERFATQPEILRYLQHVADRFALRDAIQFNTTVTSARFDSASKRWNIATSSGEQFQARFCIMATGCLSVPTMPEVDGLGSFDGAIYHSSRWPEGAVDFTGQRVAVVGTGSSGIQIIPIVAETADQLWVFQRTPSFSVPARNAPLRPELIEWIKQHYAEEREKCRRSFLGFNFEAPPLSALAASPAEREAKYEAQWQRGGPNFLAAFNDILLDENANHTAAEFVREKIRSIVVNPEVAEQLIPREYFLGAKRLCVDTQYYATFNRDNVTLVNGGPEPIERITATGIQTRHTHYPVDVLIFATGFDAMTGALLKVDFQGRDDITLKQAWAAGPANYLGLMVHGFPNLFTITGPGSPSVLSNMVVSIEQHVEWIGHCIDYMNAHHHASVEPTLDAQEHWVQHVREVANKTLFPRGNSWYLGANVPGKPRIFMPYVGGVGTYRDICNRIADNRYEGFEFHQ